MNRRIGLGAALIFAATIGAAREPMAPPSPFGAAPTSLFIGHLGQILELPQGWTADAEMRRDTEIVYFHRALVNGDPAQPFNPKPSEYTLGNFASLGLMELVVIPKDAPGGLRSLEALREAKEKSLQANRFTFKITDADGAWPSGTFHVETLMPQRFSQTYSQSSKHFYIFTAGGPLDDQAAAELRRSLAASLSPDKEVPAGKPIFPFALLGGAFLVAAYFVRMKYAFLVVILAVSPALAQVTPHAPPHADPYGALAKNIADPELRKATQEVLRMRRIDVVAQAKDQQRLDGELFDHARIEVTGVASSDDTFAFNPKDFDGQAKPSYTVDEGGLKSAAWKQFTRARRWMTGWAPDPTLPFEAMHDSLEFEQAAAGILTSRGKKALKEFAGKEINEVVAHSWGTELMYAAILNGYMLPPKKLIIVGVPDNNNEKWELLAQRTGTQVVHVRSLNDQIAKVGAMVADRHVKVDFKKKWDRFCEDRATKSSCGAHGRTPKQVEWINPPDNPGTAGHDRQAYYDILKKKGVIEGTVVQLRHKESANLDDVIWAKQMMLLESAKEEASKLVAQARGQRELAVREQLKRVEIAARERREHDDRLLAVMGDLARRACDDPDSLRQSVLDALPKPRDENFASRYPSNGLSGCSLNVFEWIRNGSPAADIVAGVYSSRGPAIIVAIPVAPGPTPPANIVAKFPSEFAMLLPEFAKFAAESCRNPGSGTAPFFSYGSGTGKTHSQFVGWYDSAYHVEMASLTGCSRRLFIDFVNLVLFEEWWKVRERGWIERQVSYYTPQYHPREPRDPDSAYWSRPADPDHDEVWKRIGRLR